VTARLMFWHVSISMPIPGLRSFVPRTGFYRRVFLNETIAEPRPFRTHGKGGIDGVRFPGRAGTGHGPFPIMRSSAFERRMLFQRDRNPSNTP